jgi:hypothetical protein
MKIACQIAINTLPSRSTEVRARLAEDHRHTRRSKCNKASLLGIEAESHQPGWRICGFCRKLRRGRAGCLLVTAQTVMYTVGALATYYYRNDSMKYRRTKEREEGRRAAALYTIFLVPRLCRGGQCCRSRNCRNIKAGGA